MKVLMITYHGGAGGISVLIKDLAYVFKDNKDIHLDVCYASLKDIYGEEVENVAPNTYCLNMKSGKDIKNGIKLLKLIKMGNYDIVHLHYFTPLLRILACLSKPKIIIQTEHGGIKAELDGKRWILMKLIHRLLKGTADIYTTVSFDSRDDLINNKIAPQNKIRVIYNGIFIDKFYKDEISRIKIRDELGISRNESVVGTVRGLTSKMGIDHLLIAAKKILTTNTKVKFLLVGDGPMRKELELLADKMNIAENIFFVGQKNDVIKYLSAMDIFVMPSVWETFGIAAVEAMCVGLPVVAYAVGGLKEVIEHNVSGLLINERNPEFLADSINYLIKNKETANLMGKKAKERAGELFNINSTAQQYLDLYNELNKSGKNN